MDHLGDIHSGQEATASGDHMESAPTVHTSASENPAVQQFIFHRALVAELAPIGEHRFEHPYGTNTYVSPRSAPPDIAGHNPWSLSTQSSPIDHPALTPSPGVTHQPTPVMGHHTAHVAFAPHPPVSALPPPHVAPLSFAFPQGPGLGLHHAGNQPYPQVPFAYPAPFPALNPVRALPTLTHIPLLTGRMDFGS